MIRSLFVSLFFFFGPALLLFMLRNITLLLLLKLKSRQENAPEIEIIDVTPVIKERAPTWFYALVIAISLACAVTVFMNLENGEADVQKYVPAYMDESGNIVSGDWDNKQSR